MSWIKENYHIAALGGGVLVLAGLGFLGFSGNQAVNQEFNANNPSKKTDTTVPGGDIADKIIASVTELDPIDQRSTKSGRPVELFTSVDLYTRGENTRDLLDPLQMEDSIHKDIDNKWWSDHGIDLTYSDSPERDQDGDGFTNREEFAAETDPNDPKSHGALLTKLEVKVVESDMWLLLFKSVLGGSGYQFDMQYKAFGGPVQSNRIPAQDAVEKGNSFFKNDPGKDRFVLIDVEGRMEDGPTGRRPRNWAIVEDQRPNKKGKKYELPFNLELVQRREATQYDHTVTFSLNAIGEAANTFKVEENGKFSLPTGGTELNYTLVEVKLGEDRLPASVVVQMGDDESTRREIPVPQTAP
jgi:hypothetical protein